MNTPTGFLVVHGVRGASRIKVYHMIGDLSQFQREQLTDVSSGWSPGFTTAFIDWLRRDDDIIGVGVTPLGEFEWLLQQDEFENVEVEQNARLLIYFGEQELFDRRSSSDHKMLRTRFFKHLTNDEFLMLIESDLHQLEGIPRVRNLPF